MYVELVIAASLLKLIVIRRHHSRRWLLATATTAVDLWRVVGRPLLTPALQETVVSAGSARSL